VYVNNSENIELYGLNIQGIDLTGRSYCIFYSQSTGDINNCTVSPNQKGNMNSLAIRAHWNSTISIENCDILNYGRIGIYIRTGTTLYAENNRIIGQIYTDEDGDYVSYGIEVEDLLYTCHADIRHNEIYNHDHVGNPTWSSAAIIIDALRYYQETDENCSATIEYNDIHDNMIGVQIVPNDNIHVNRNKIYSQSSHGAVSDPYRKGPQLIYHDLDATGNWWGNATGPYHPSENPGGTGDEITDYVVFEPYFEYFEPQINLTAPKMGFVYINIRDIIVLKLPFFTNLIIGKLEIETDVPDCLYGVDRVEFFIDDEYKDTANSEPYSWMWDERVMFLIYNVKVVVYDKVGNMGSDDIMTWKFL
jgi:hypothetical protein